MPHFRRSIGIPRFAAYQSYRPYLRTDFRHQCAYCGITEVYRRSDEGFGIDHFRPKKLFPELETQYENLYYCCNRCNRYKGFAWPTETGIANGFQFCDPCEADPYESHLSTAPDGSLHAHTPSGEYTLHRLRLNRKELLDFRTRRAALRTRIDACRAILGQLNLHPSDPRQNAIEAVIEELQREWNSSFAP